MNVFAGARMTLSDEGFGDDPRTRVRRSSELIGDALVLTASELVRLRSPASARQPTDSSSSRTASGMNHFAAVGPCSWQASTHPPNLLVVPGERRRMRAVGGVYLGRIVETL
jgi:hypothetical protein